MSYEEKRVRVKNYGVLGGKSPLLVDVPGTGGKARRLHVLAAAGLAEITWAVGRNLGIRLQIASGWRRHRWTSREHYETFVTEKYGSVRAGRKWLAYDSPHETGLAIDIGVGGLVPNRKTRDEQRETPLHKWLVDNAHRFGWHPYKAEPWHWEFPISKRAWESGEADDEAIEVDAGDDDGDGDDPCVEDEFEEV
ncbi:D-alanyl-D-alanine carboxypeptidase family protein [Enhygromyxa salina]|uniref:D-alanyl-D-alanine carboxypeptidase family protein n=1 Tax=Enhygromyxa salina TaxID=215803 RepID=UPI0015E61E80|nr:D-alanyl-D-alanine carboxypeptidase family protein [Enhygromyxa salina]